MLFLKRIYNMYEARYIHGFPKIWIDIKIALRLFFSLVFKYGLLNSIKELNSYIKDARCLFNTNPNRYIKAGDEIIAVPDMPPVNSKDFIDYVIKDIEWINHNIQPQLVFAIVCITSKCPFKCPYCYNSDLHTVKERLEIEIIISTIDGLIKKGVKSIYLSGGEPMTRWDDLLLILKTFKNTNTRFWLLTTGYNLTSDKLAILKGEGLKGLMISLDTFDGEQINKVKGSPKAFDNAITAIEAANKLGFVVAIDCVFGKTLLEKENFRKFIETAGSFGAHFINCYTPRQMHHELENEYSNFGLPEYQKLDLLTKENQISSTYTNLPIANSPDLWEAKRGCVGGKLFIYMDPDGNIKFCPFVDKSFGNVAKEELSIILDRLQNRDTIHVCKTNKMLFEN